MNVFFRSLVGCLAVFFAAAASAACPRIVSQSPYLTHALEWLGRGECIVGVSRYDKRELPRTGGVMDPDVESIAALRPDLVVTSNWADAEVMAMAMPAGAKLLQLDGFGSLADTEAMLAQLARASRAPGGRARVEDFRREWRKRARAVDGRGRRVMVVTGCAGLPYSFGRRHLVGDVFAHAGFEVVDDAKIRHLRQGEELPDLAAAVARFRPEILFSLEREDAEHCKADIGLLPTRIIALKGEPFFHPGAGVLDGLAELAARMKP